MKKISSEDALILNAIRIARFVVRVLPVDVSMALARVIGRAVFWTSKRRRIAYKNLRMAFASEKSPRELKRIACASMENLAMSGIDLLRIPEMMREDVEKNFRIEGREIFEPYFERKQGIIFLTGHFGSWELLNIAGSLLGYPMVALARIQKHPRSDAYLNQLRTSKGSQVIHKGMPVREILRALRRGQIVGILSDQDGGKNGSFVRFFNRYSSTPAGAATFALHTDAVIFPIFIFREKNHCHRIELEGPLQWPDSSLEPREAERFILQQFAEALEKQIRRAPEQWLWAHRRWKSSPDKNVLILSDGKAGHLNQSLAVVEAIRQERTEAGLPLDSLHIQIVELHFKNDFNRVFSRVFSFIFRLLPLFVLKACLTDEAYRQIIACYADIVISCGSSLTDVNLWAKRENSAKSVVIMKPYSFLRHFDAVLVPHHDRFSSAPNVFMTDGALSPLTSVMLEKEGEVLRRELFLDGCPKIGLLVGGDTEMLKLDKQIFEGILSGLKNFGKETGSSILITTSRRTPAWADSLLKQTFDDPKRCPLLLIANEANRSGVVGGILGLSDVVLVSGESVSMVSEAVASGKRVAVFMPFSSNGFKPKYAEFLRHMESQNKIVFVEPGNIVQKLKEEMLKKPSPNAASGDWQILKKAVRIL